MIYEIKRDDLTNLVHVVFADGTPLDVRIALKNAGFSYYGWGEDGSWKALGSSIADDKIRKIINDAITSAKPRHVMTKGEETALKEEYLRRITANGNEHWRKYHEDNIGALVVLTNGDIFCIEKPRIKTHFCFGESGYDADDASHMAEVARTREDYFLRENLRDIKRKIDLLSCRVACHCDRLASCRYYSDRDGIVAVGFYDRFDRNGNRIDEELCEEDRERVLEGYRKVYAAFEKRLHTYLKRYGLSKIHSWTYWRDA